MKFSSDAKETKSKKGNCENMKKNLSNQMKKYYFY